MTVVLVLGLTVMAMAASDTSDVTVIITLVDVLTLIDGGTITLDDAGGWSGTDSTAVLNYTHNSATSKQITAVTTDPGGTHDITLTVAVQDGTGPEGIVVSGTVQAAQVVYTGIAAGTLTDKAVTYTASATAAGSRAGNYVFTVTFTSSDVS